MRTMHLNLFAFACGHHAAAWRAADSAVDRLGDISYWQELARTAERGRLDAIFLGDGQSAGLGRVADGPTWYLEPLTTLASLAGVTTDLGLVSTVSSTFWDPFHAARVVSSLDHISGGRAGINVVTSQTDEEARNHGMDKLPNHAARYARAGEFIATLTELWDSWPREATVIDRAGMYADPSKLHRIGHHDRWFDVEGPLNIPRSPQGRPVISQAGASEPGRDLAARCADVVFTVAWDIETAKAFRADVRARAEAHGRNPDDITVLPGLVAYVGDTEEDAHRKQRELTTLLPEQDALRGLSELIGEDVSGWDLDAPVPDLPPIDKVQGSRGLYATVLHIVATAGVRGSGSGEDHRPTLRELLGYLAAGGGHATFLGTPEQIADEMERWIDEGAADGFNLMPPTLPAGLDDVVDRVVPLLQERGRLRRDYSGGTLRENLREQLGD
jgi:FMN-dependent oxidoreductase (nitrilotriacetate monooxygenase family)